MFLGIWIRIYFTSYFAAYSLLPYSHTIVNYLIDYAIALISSYSVSFFRRSHYWIKVLVSLSNDNQTSFVRTKYSSSFFGSTEKTNIVSGRTVNSARAQGPRGTLKAQLSRA